MRPLIGAIAWLKPEDEIDDHLPVGLNAGACNHPCLIIDVQAVQPVQQARILIVSALVLHGRSADDSRSQLSVGRLALRGN